MTRRFTVFAIVCAVVACATVAQAVPVFYLNSSNSVAGTPGDIGLTGVAPNSTGQLFLWVNTDVRLSGIDLELTETGGGIRFTGAEWLNPSNRWALTGTPTVTNSLVSLLQGGAIPLVVGGGVGPGSPGADAGPSVLLGSINYTAGANPGTSQLALKVGSQTIADWDGAAPNVRFGANAPPDVPGGTAGGTDGVGSIQVGTTQTNPPVITPVNLGEVEQSTTIMAQLTASNTPTWSALTPTTGSPAIAATLSPTGQFSWNPAGSARGPKGSGTVAYSWTATATNADGADTRVAISLTLIPEPATISLFGLAMVGVLGLVRRRS